LIDKASPETAVKAEVVAANAGGHLDEDNPENALR
jgi:hypothetical protein